MERVLLCVDLSYQVYRASAAHPMLTSRRTFTGGLYGFLQTFAKTVRETKATHVAFCQDRKPYLRSLDYPDYKRLRKANADEELLKMYKQSMSLVIDILEGAGMVIWGEDGFESDDMTAHCVMKYRHRFDRIYAASNDSDLFQLLWADNFYIYTKSIHDVWTRAGVMKEHGLTPDQFMLVTAMTGTHNDIAGITGVGPKTAKKAIEDPALMRKWRDSHGAIIDRNLGLIKLPHPKFPGQLALPETTHRFSDRELYKSLGRYDIDVTSSMINAFEQIQTRRTNEPSRFQRRT